MTVRCRRPMRPATEAQQCVHRWEVKGVHHGSRRQTTAIPSRYRQARFSRSPLRRQRTPLGPHLAGPVRARVQACRAPARVRAARSPVCFLRRYGGAPYAAIVGTDYCADRQCIAGSRNKEPTDRPNTLLGQQKATRSFGPRRCTLLQEATAYFPSRSESPGTARSIASLTRWNESFVAYFASFQVRRDVPLTRSQSRDRSLSTSSNFLP
jgi:hypothetical protein